MRIKQWMYRQMNIYVAFDWFTCMLNTYFHSLCKYICIFVLFILIQCKLLLLFYFSRYVLPQFQILLNVSLIFETTVSFSKCKEKSWSITIAEYFYFNFFSLINWTKFQPKCISFIITQIFTGFDENPDS